MSGVEVLIVLFCAGGFLVILALGAWVLINRSRLEQPNESLQDRLDALDREYAAGDLDEDEYDRRRARLENDRMRS